MSIRAAVEAAGAWPLNLVENPAFIEDLRALAEACNRLSVSDAALASASTDADASVSMVARSLVAYRTLCGAAVRPPHHGLRVEVECDSVAHALQVLRERSISMCAAPGAFVEALRGFEVGVEFAAHGCDKDGRRPEAALEFNDSEHRPVQIESFAAAIGVASADLRAALLPYTLMIRVAQPMFAALGLWALERPDQPAALWSWPAPETPRLVVAGAMQFSASRLNTYARCPRRWFFEYLCDAVADPGSVHSSYGRVFHQALEALHREIRFPAQHEQSEILTRLLRELEGAFARARADFASPLEYEVCRRRARLVAEHYARWLYREARAQPFEVRDVEIAQKFSAGGHVFVGYVDRIDRPVGGGPVIIFDYKTGRIDDDPDAYLQKVRDGDEAQLALYYAMRRAHGDDIARLALVSVRDPRDAVWLLALDIVDDAGAAAPAPAPQEGVLRATCTATDLDTAMQTLIERCNLLARRGAEHFAAGEDPPCAFCAYARACRERPADEERIFAR